MKFLNEDINNLFYEKRKGVKKSAQKSKETTTENTETNESFVEAGKAKIGHFYDIKNRNDKTGYYQYENEDGTRFGPHAKSENELKKWLDTASEEDIKKTIETPKPESITESTTTALNESKYEIVYDFTDFGGDESEGVREVFEGSWDELRAYIENMKKEGCYNIEATCIDDCTPEKEEQITEGYTQFEIDDEYEKVIEDIVDRLDDDEKDDDDAIMQAIDDSLIYYDDLFVVAVKRLSEDTDLLNKIVFGEDEFEKLVDDVREYVKNN